MLNVFRSRPKYAKVQRTDGEQRREFPDNLWTRCDRCGQMLYNKELEKRCMSAHADTISLICLSEAQHGC